jgi:hypothetical protein
MEEKSAGFVQIVWGRNTGGQPGLSKPVSELFKQANRMHNAVGCGARSSIYNPVRVFD